MNIRIHPKDTSQFKPTRFEDFSDRYRGIFPNPYITITRRNSREKITSKSCPSVLIKTTRAALYFISELSCSRPRLNWHTEEVIVAFGDLYRIRIRTPALDLLGYDKSRNIALWSVGIIEGTQPKRPYYMQTIGPGASAGFTNIDLKSEANELIERHTSWYKNLDEAKLGMEFIALAKSGRYELAQQVLEQLGNSDRDDVSVEFMNIASDFLSDDIIKQEGGRRLLDRMFYELTSGEMFEDEQKQASRILVAKSSLIALTELVKGALSSRTKIFPIRYPGLTVLNAASLSAKLMPNGDVHVTIPCNWVYLNDYFAAETKTLPETICTSGTTIKENEIVGVKWYDEGEVVQFGPALILILASNNSDAKTFHKILDVAALAGGTSSTFAKTAVRGAIWLLWADRVAVTIWGISSIIDEHRGEILKIGGETGKTFLRVNDVLHSAVGLYGIARIAIEVPSLILKLHKSYIKLRMLASLSKKSTKELEQINVLLDNLTDLPPKS